MTRHDHASGATVVIEPAPDTPLCWISVAARTGTSSDPVGQEGFWRHAFELARRGTHRRDRSALDEDLDRLGASIDAYANRDYSGFSAICLEPNANAVVDLFTEILAEPSFAASEHDKLIRESHHLLDEIRDDDAEVAQRFFARFVAPGYPYSRTGLGTDESLEAIDRDAALAGFRSALHPSNLVIGLAGDIDSDRAMAIADRLIGSAASHGSAPPPTVDLTPPPLPPAAILLVDKPERTQSQILSGHLGPVYGTSDYLSLLPGEAAFGGMFSSRLMQEVRVQRGWSYGASFRVGHARGAAWQRISLAPAVDQTAPALSLCDRLYRELREGGILASEHELATRYLSGQIAFQLATARRRLAVAMEAPLLGVDDALVRELPARLSALALDDVQNALRAWIRPEALRTVVVATADELLAPLEDLGLGAVEVVDYESY